MNQTALSLTGGSPVPRPKLTIDQEAEAIESIAAIVDIPAKNIAFTYSRHMDGYTLARALDDSGSLRMVDVEALDGVGSLIDEAQRKLEKQWAEDTNPQPPFPIGTRIKLGSFRGKPNAGVITGICTHSAANYLVKEDDCTQDGRFRVIKFEDAVPEVATAASASKAQQSLSPAQAQSGCAQES